MYRLFLFILCTLMLYTLVGNASTVQLPRSGQTTAYSPTDDGAVRTGKAWPSPRFSDNGNDTVTDNLTGLIWTRDANLMKGRDPEFDADDISGDGAVTWQHALDYMKKLNAENYLGYNDWRLPNLNELTPLVNQREARISDWLNGQDFIGAEPLHYWSSSTNVSSPGSAWTVSMDGGAVNYLGKSGLGNVWPVRGGQSGAAASSGIDLPKTGQFACFDTNGATVSCAGTGQDGELQTGAAWPQPRFSDNGDQTVTDNLTGLIWIRDANLMIARNPSFDVDGTNHDDAATWQGALDYVQELNQETYLGFSDWRLPNRNELASLVNYMETNPLAWLNWQGFYSVQTKYWSSGTVASVTGKAWNVYNTGVILGENKSASAGGRFVWPIRGGTANAATTQAAAAVADVLSISTSALADGYITTTYSQTLAATGGTIPYTWSKSSGTLPAGLTLSAGGVISGTPTTAGTSSVTVKVKDAVSATATKTLSITVYAALKVSTTTLTNGYPGVVYSQALAATGGKTPYSWSVTGGTLPAGLAISSAGVISGTPTSAGSSTFTVQVADANSVKASKSMTIVINAALTITTMTLPDGYVGTAYSKTLAATGGKTKYTWSKTSGTLPAGLAISSAGVISGKPTTAGSSSFTVQVKDANNTIATKELTITIYTTVSVSTASLPAGTVGIAYSQTLAATGGKTPYTWSRTAGTLPAGLTFSTAGVLSGTPTTAVSNRSVTFQVKDANNTKATKALTITVNAALSVSTASLPAGNVGSDYSQTLAAAGGKTPYSWSLTSGSLPAGLSINGETGAITGTPATTGSSSFTVQVTDGNNTNVSKALTITINAAVLKVSTVTLPNGYIGIAYSQTLAATSGKTPYTWSRTAGTLPAGLTFSTAGVLSGTPTTAVSNRSVTFQVKDANNTKAPKVLTITVNAVLSVSTASLPAGNIGSDYSQTLAAAGGKTPYSWSLTSGSLTAGLSLNGETGAITGTPATTGNCSFTVQAKDSNNTTATKVLTITINAAVLRVSTATLPDGYIGILYSQTLAAAGGKVPYHWSISSGSLPAGFILDYISGVISGTPGATENSSFTIQVMDANSIAASKVLSITVTPPLLTVRSLGDTGNVEVMEATGNYDVKKADGAINDQPRLAIAKEYFKTHGDLDFLVILSTFDYAMPETGAQGFYLGVKNDVQGINSPIIDNSALFGSAGMLQGTIDLGNVTALAANLYGQKLDDTVTTLNHELMHRFGAYVRYKHTDGTFNTSLLGKDSAHWSYLLDSKGSLMYGNGWKDNGNGTFTSTAKMSGYSPLDLYLMGMIPKESVPPMLLIDNPAIDKTQLPQLGATVSGTAKTVTIDDIIAAEGARVPDAASSQKKFNIGFVLLTRAGDNATAAVQAIETVRMAFAGRFAELTQGTGGVNGITPSATVVIDSPADGATITGPDVTVSGAVINSTGMETGVTVNGMPATTTGSHFIANHVPLQTGYNSLTITAIDANGLTATVSRNVTATAGNYIRITSNIDSGVAPLDITLSLDGSFTIANPALTVSGPVAVMLTQGTSQTEFTAQVTAEGTYTFTASAVGPDSQTYSDMVTVTLMSKSQLEALLKGKWDGMKQKVIIGDTQGAGTYFPLASRDMFQAIFSDPTIDSLSRLNDITAIEIYTITDGSAQGGLIRQDADGVFSYPISFARDEIGLWRIYNF